MDKKVRKQWRWPARTAFLSTALICGPCYVEMRPFEPLGELAKECRSGDRTALAPADIREIREIALELIGILFGERHVPCLVVRSHTGLHELTHELFVVT